jgi:hypothetical protein
MAEALEKTCSFTITVNCPATAFAEKSRPRLMVNVLPNPASTYFTLNTTSNINGFVQLRVTNVMGILVEQRNNIAVNSSINIGHQYSRGVYFIQIIQGKETISVQVIKH